MADSKITALTALTAADPINDMFPVVDVSDTSMAASGTTKRISVNNILSSSPTASGALTVTGLVTAGSATITGDLTVDTSTLKVDSTNNRVGVGTASPATALQVVGEIRSSADISNSSDTIIYSFSGGTAGSVRAGLQLIGSTPEIRVYLSSATALTINSTSNLVLKGGTAAANGVGLTFPAAQVASSDANCLDDYEEGTFTPTVIGSTLAGVGTYTQQKGFYTKVGRLVTVNVWLQWTAHTGTGNMSFSGLPFTIQNTSGNYGGISIGYVSNIALTAGNVIYGLTEFGTTNVTVAQSPTGGGTYSLVPMDISAEIAFTATYIV